MVGFLAIRSRRKDYTTLFDCSSLVKTYGIVYFICILIGLGYAFCVVKTVFVMEDHLKSLKICLLVDKGLGAAKISILAGSLLEIATRTERIK